MGAIVHLLSSWCFSREATWVTRKFSKGQQELRLGWASESLEVSRADIFAAGRSDQALGTCWRIWRQTGVSQVGAGTGTQAGPSLPPTVAWSGWPLRLLRQTGLVGIPQCLPPE